MIRLLRRRTRERAAGRRDERGAVLVEAAIVTPIFFALVLGITEIGLAMKDNLTLSHSVRAGSRVASASGDDVYADYGIVQAIARESTVLNRGDIVRIVVYKASRVGEDPTDGCKGGTPQTGVCNVYTPADFSRDKDEWGCRTDIANPPDLSWCPKTRKVSLTGGGPEHVGVWMQVEHAWITGMFGDAVTLTDQSVIRLEPRMLNDD